MGHILIIDRDVTDTHPLTAALAAQGYKTTVLAQGADAVGWAKEHRPDAILLSVELVGVSGYAICNRLKKDDELRNIPLLLASAEATEEVFAEHRRLKTRADAYLYKPYDPPRVLQALQQSAKVAPAPAPQMESDGDNDPLMSTDALLLLEGSVDVNKHTQVIRLPMGAKGERAKDLIGAALADMDANAMTALVAMEGRVDGLEATVRSQAAHIAQQHTQLTQLTDALARAEDRQRHSQLNLHTALRGSMQLCLDALEEHQKTQ